MRRIQSDSMPSRRSSTRPTNSQAISRAPTRLTALISNNSVRAVWIACVDARVAWRVSPVRGVDQLVHHGDQLHRQVAVAGQQVPLPLGEPQLPGAQVEAAAVIEPQRQQPGEDRHHLDAQRRLIQRRQAALDAAGRGLEPFP